jgi:hypothetical protein
VADLWLPRMWLLVQAGMFAGLLGALCAGIGNGTVQGLLAAVSGSLVGGNVYALMKK